MTSSLYRLFRGVKPHRARRTVGAPRLESLEDRIVMSWSAVPPASIAVPTAYTSVGLNSLNDASGTASNTAGEIDWYRFTAPSTGSYALAATTPSSSLDTVIGLYNASGGRVAYNDDSGGGTDSLTSASLSANQVYYLGVTNYSGSSARGAYNWSINGPNDDVYENNDTRATATNLGVLQGPAYSLTGLQSRDEDWYRFTTTASGLATDYVRINFTHSQGDLDIGLYNSAGTLVRTSTGVSNQEQISLDGLAAGAYTVRVYGYAGARNPNYSLTVEAPDDAYENNDTLATATNLGVLQGPTYSLSGLRQADDDWYRFTTTASGLATDFVRVNFAHSQGDVDLGLYNSAGTLIRSSTGTSNQEQISLDGLAAGTYSVRVYGFAGARNPNYSLTVEAPDDAYENNDTLATASNLGVLQGATFSRTGLRQADDDWYRFTTTAPGLATDYVRINFLHSQGDVDLGLYNSAGTLIRSSTGTSNQELISLDGLAAGTYSVRVYGFAGARNPNYSLTVEAPDDAYENNDTLATATNLGVLQGPAYTLSGLRQADDDWYRFTTTASGLATDFVRVNFAHSQGDVDLGLYDSAGTLIRSSTGTSNQEQISLNGLAAGSYSVRVYGFAGARNPNYSLTVDAPDDAYENNDTLATAFNLGSAATSSTRTGLRLADDDWFRFTTTSATDYVRINFLHSQGDIDMALYNASGVLIASSGGVGNQELISLVGRAAGTYYVRIFGFAGARNPNYSLTLVA